ncbi:MAG: carboxypeptidase regulatory-like domain-containing protein [Elusimicrobia bacterium]|nr:carboxypeptidase regulatory-like domain-containing protein [Elusimicrobiota bacterium]
MKKIFGILWCLAAVAAPPLFAVDLNVSVKNPSGAGIPGAQVIAVQFTDTGMGAETKTAVADAAGLAQFTGGNTLTASNQYDIFATTQGYLPSLGDQFGADHPSLFASGTLSPITITLSSAGVSRLGEIHVDVENATPATLIFGEVRPASGYNRDVVARGFVMSDGGGDATLAGAGQLKIFNVPFASTSAYNISGLDTSNNRGYGFPGDRELAAYRPLIRYAVGAPNPLTDSNNILQFDNAVKEQETQSATQNYAATGDVSVEGAVIDTTTAQTPIPFVGVNFGYMRNDPYCGNNCSSNVWAHTDANGRFQLFGLQPNTSYYAQVYGGCNGQTQTCYEGSNSTWTAYTPSTSAPLALNDFYYANTPLIKKIKLRRSSGGTGQIQVYVKDSFGNSMPQSSVGLWPDGMQWDTDGTCATTNDRIHNPGLANGNVQATTGYALLSNLPAGNYSLQAWTQFSNKGGVTYNAGPDGQFAWGGGGNCGTDDLRVTVSTTAPYVRIFNSSGTQVGGAVSSITITVPVTVNTTGLVKGTLHFPSVVNLSNDPINITLQVQCTTDCSGGGGGFTVINGAAVGPDVAYQVNVASGQSYWMNVTSNYWGIVRAGGGNNGISLVSTGTVIRDMTFAPAGRLIGKLYKPDTSLFQPTFSNSDSVTANINASANNSWGYTQVNQDGSFALGGLLPGSYKLRVQGWGQFTYTDPEPVPTATIVAGQDTSRDLRLVAGVAVKINASTASLPSMHRPNCAGQDSWKCPPEQWGVFRVPQGMDFSQKIASILVNEDEASEFGFAISTVGSGGKCGGPVSQAGFCVKRVPSPSTLDFYLLRKGLMDEANIDAVRPYFVILNSTKNIVVKSELATDLYFQNMSTISVQPVNLAPASVMPSVLATLRGSVIGANFIRQQDFESLGGDFNNFIKFIPILSLFDSSGTLRAAAAIVPSPTCFEHGGGGDQFDQAVAAGNWSLFKSIFENCPVALGYSSNFGYEIRGLNPGQVYSAVLTSPNYPPYQTSVTMGVAGSTTTLNVNLDQTVGSGATLTGVVRSTNNVVVANAAVSIEAPGFNNDKVKAVTTNASGVYQVQGLPAGTYKISVVAAGYALASANTDVSGTAIFTTNFSLRLAGAAITGTVKSASTRKRLEGVRIFAYNDTQNVNDPAAELPLYRAVTSSVGYYSIDGLEAGVVYKVFAKTSGYFVTNQSTATVVGTVPGIDFLLKPKPLDVKVFAHRGALDYEFTILNPGDFPDGDAWIGASPFVKAVSTNVGNSFQTIAGTDGDKFILKYPLSNLTAGKDYVLHIEASDPSSSARATITKEVVFGLGRTGNVNQSIDDTLLGDDEADAQGRKGNAAALDVTGDNASALSIPVGSMIPQSTGTIPSLKFSEVALDTSPAAAVLSSTAAFVSGVYNLEISSVSLTAKGFDLVLAYDKLGADLGDLAIHKFNDATQKWDMVPGLQTISPLKGTVTVKRIKSLASVLGLKSSSPMRAMSDGRTYTPNANLRIQAVTDSGIYAIMRPSVVGTSYAGTTIKVFNFPNPFNLSTKTNTLVHGGANTTLTTAGTVIKYELPAHISGHVYIRIYTLSGELVQEFDQGEQSGGAYYYTAWDGKNRSGSEVANGVYYGILSVPGAKLKDSTFKMAVIK